MKKFKFAILGLLALLLGACCMTSCGIEKVGTSYEAVKVSLVGDNRGISNENLVTGWVFYNPALSMVLKYPLYIQTIDYEPFTVNAKGGSEFTVDPTISFRLMQGKSPQFATKYLKPMGVVAQGAILNYVKEAFRIELNKFSPDDIINYRDSLESAIENKLRMKFIEEYLDLDNLTSGLKYPKKLVDAIDEKNVAVQEALTEQIRIQASENKAQAAIRAAEGEMEANKLRERALTDKILQQMWIEKWNGQLPSVSAGSGTGFMLNLSGIK